MPLRAIHDRDDARFAEGAHDIRHFAVCTGADGEKVGEVDGMVIDETGRMRFAAVDIDGEQRHVLLPADQATSDLDGRTVWIPGIRRQQLREIPSWDGDPLEIDPDYEARLHAAYNEAQSVGGYAEPFLASPRAGAGPDEPRIERVDRLEGIDVASGDLDPREWTVLGSDRKVLGRIEHLIGDTTSMRVAYLEMAVDEHRAGGARKVLIPTEHAHLDRNTRRVYVEALDAERVGLLPSFDGTLAPDDQRAIEAIYGARGERR